MKSVLGLVFLIVVLSGCATQRFEVGGAVAPTTQADLEESQPFFLYGVGQDSTVDAAEVCGSAANIASIEVEQNALDSVLAFLTGNIYTPRTARVYCLS